MGGAAASFGKVAKFAAVGATVGLVAVAVAAATVVRVVGTLVTGAFRIAATAARFLWTVGVAAFNGIVGAAKTALGIVTKIGTVIAGALVSGLVIGLKKTDEWARSWLELERRAGAFGQEVKGIVAASAGGLFNKSQIAGAANELDRGGATLGQFAALLPLVKDTAAATGEKIEDIAKAVTKAAQGQLEYAGSIGFMTDENALNQVAVGLYGKKNEKLSEEQKRVVALNTVLLQMLQYRGAEAAALNTVGGAFTQLKNTFLEGLAVMAEGFIGSSGIVGMMQQLTGTIAENQGLFAAVGQALGEGFRWAAEKGIEFVGIVIDNMPTIIGTVQTVASVIGQGIAWAYNQAIALVAKVQEHADDIKGFILGVWEAVPGVINTAMEWGHTFLVGMIAIKDTLSSGEFWSGVGDVLIQAFGDAVIGAGKLFDTLLINVAAGIDGLISKIPGVETTSAQDFMKEQALGEKTSAMVVGALTGLTGSKNLADSFAGVPISNKTDLLGSMFGENYAKAKNQFSKDPISLPSLMPPIDPVEEQRRAMAAGAKRARESGGKHSSWGGMTLINHVNYQPGAQNIAFLQRQMGASGGVL